MDVIVYTIGLLVLFIYMHTSMNYVYGEKQQTMIKVVVAGNDRQELSKSMTDMRSDDVEIQLWKSIWLSSILLQTLGQFLCSGRVE